MNRDGGAPQGWRAAVDLGLVVLGVALIGLTVAVVALRAVPPAVVNNRFDITILTTATLIAGAVAALDWTRGRVTHDPAALLRSSAFTVLAVLNTLTLVAGLVGADAVLGATLDDPGQLPIVAGVVGRGVASALLVCAGWAALSRRVPALRPRVVLIGPAAAVLVVLVATAMARNTLPNLVPDDVVDALSADPTAPLALAAAPALVVFQTFIGAGFLVAALLAHRSFRRSGRLADALLAAGLLVAAFSQVHSAIHPGSYSSVVTIADLLRLAFYGLLLVGVVAERRQDLADLRAATVEVRRLAAAEFAAAGLEERARLAREIHDGLAQDLWYAKLKQSRLAQLVGFQDEAQRLSEEVAGAIDAALAEARHAIAAMREGAESGPLLTMLARHADDFSDRFALRAELISDGPIPELGPRAQAEVLRIVQEAMTNARRHADATVVQVRVARDGDLLRVSISDNGRGFKPADVARGFGLDSMRQRAAVIGGELSVVSAPQNGTIVELLLPIRRGEATGG
ncbi:MAG: sensor histidine kinase [Chloroflexi bacterium]|nr:sensor histidine kinase [Chloroflexota bacterium]